MFLIKKIKLDVMFGFFYLFVSESNILNMI